MWEVLVMYFSGVSEAGLSHRGKHHIKSLFLLLVFFFVWVSDGGRTLLVLNLCDSLSTGSLMGLALAFSGSSGHRGFTP